MTEALEQQLLTRLLLSVAESRWVDARLQARELQRLLYSGVEFPRAHPAQLLTVLLKAVLHQGELQ